MTIGAASAERQGRAPGLYDETLQRAQQEKLFRRPEERRPIGSPSKANAAMREGGNERTIDE